MYTLYREQFLQTTLQEAWDFVSNPLNLNLITPDNFKFTIISEPPGEIFDGLLIAYRLKLPFLGMRTWISEIKHIRPYESFVDEQRVGPYKFWYHYHEIKKASKGVVMIDRIHYEIPFYLIGRLAHALFVKKSLTDIFDFRRRKLEEIFADRM